MWLQLSSASSLDHSRFALTTSPRRLFQTFAVSVLKNFLNTSTKVLLASLAPVPAPTLTQNWNSCSRVFIPQIYFKSQPQSLLGLLFAQLTNHTLLVSTGKISSSLPACLCSLNTSVLNMPGLTALSAAGKAAMSGQRRSYFSKVFKVRPYEQRTCHHHGMHLQSCTFIQMANQEDPSSKKGGEKGLSDITGAWARAYLLHLVLGI